MCSLVWSFSASLELSHKYQTDYSDELANNKVSEYDQEISQLHTSDQYMTQ